MKPIPSYGPEQKVSREFEHPQQCLSLDNAVMIAAAAYPKFLAGQFASWDIPPDASLVLGQ
ncbi:MAG: hypothetical protein HY313_11295 [Acidobacteria bacterium]|nr:hypothetical protein [Acidobacteriota bacterium]